MESRPAALSLSGERSQERHDPFRHVFPESGHAVEKDLPMRLRNRPDDRSEPGNQGVELRGAGRGPPERAEQGVTDRRRQLGHGTGERFEEARRVARCRLRDPAANRQDRRARALRKGGEARGKVLEETGRDIPPDLGTRPERHPRAKLLTEEHRRHLVAGGEIGLRKELATPSRIGDELEPRFDPGVEAGSRNSRIDEQASTDRQAGDREASGFPRDLFATIEPVITVGARQRGQPGRVEAKPRGQRVTAVEPVADRQTRRHPIPDALGSESRPRPGSANHKCLGRREASPGDRLARPDDFIPSGRRQLCERRQGGAAPLDPFELNRVEPVRPWGHEPGKIVATSSSMARWVSGSSESAWVTATVHADRAPTPRWINLAA